jgi:hypothetical protein
VTHHRARARALLVPAVLALVLLEGCGGDAKKTAGSPAPSRAARVAPAAGDALFLAEAPVVVPDEVESELDAMKVGRLYAAGATLSATGHVTHSPPPPGRIRRPVVLAVMADRGAEAQLANAKGELVGEVWGAGIAKAVAEAKTWADVSGVHLHLLPSAESIPTLAPALKAVRRITGLPLSLAVPSTLAPEALKPLAGAVDEVLVLTFGRRPETNDRVMPELSEAAARDMPVPFRLLFVTGGYGIGGSGRRIPDGEVDALSENHALDFEFGQILSSEPGNVYDFHGKAGADASRSPLARDGGRVRFQVLSAVDLVRALGDVASWGKTPILGRVFLVDGVPKDGHLLGFPAVRALLTGRPVEPRLEIDLSPGPSGRGWAELSIVATNVAPSPTDLSHFNNWVQLRVEGGVIANVREGDFDRFALLSSEAEGARPMSFGKAPVCRLYENLYAAGESNVAGPVRVAGAHPRLFVSYRLSNGGAPVNGPEIEKILNVAPPEVKPAPKRKR